jgi:hypothetical protein
MTIDEQWKNRDPRCTYLPMIDGQCKRCLKYPLYNFSEYHTK